MVNRIWIDILTIRVQLVCIGCQSAVVPVIRYTIVVIIRVTCVPFAIFVVVSLVGVGHIGTVVLVVLMTIFINVLVIITVISDQVVVYIGLLNRKRLLTLPVPIVAWQHLILCTVVQNLLRVV